MAKSVDPMNADNAGKRIDTAKLGRADKAPSLAPLDTENAKLNNGLRQDRLAKQSSQHRHNALRVDMSTLPTQLGIDFNTHVNALGGPMTTLDIEREMKNPNSRYRAYAMQALMYIVVLMINKIQVIQAAELMQKMKHYAALLSLKVPVGHQLPREFLEKCQLEEGDDLQAIQIRDLINASQAEIDVVLDQFEGREKALMAYAIDAGRYIHEDIQTIQQSFDAILADADQRGERERTQALLDDWQERYEMHERNDARLLQQPDLAAILPHVPVPTREMQRLVNGDLTRRGFAQMFSQVGLRNTVVDDLTKTFLSRDEVLLREHARKGLPQFKLKLEQPLSVNVDDLIDQTGDASLKQKSLRPAYSELRAFQQQKQRVQQSLMHTMVNDIYTKIDTMSPHQLAFNQVVEQANQRIAKFAQTMNSPTPSPLQRKEAELVDKTYEAINKVKQDGPINAYSVEALRQAISDAACDLREESEFAKSLEVATAKAVFTIKPPKPNPA